MGVPWFSVCFKQTGRLKLPPNKQWLHHNTVKPNFTSGLRMLPIGGEATVVNFVSVSPSVGLSCWDPSFFNGAMWTHWADFPQKVAAAVKQQVFFYVQDTAARHIIPSVSLERRQKWHSFCLSCMCSGILEHISSVGMKIPEALDVTATL